MRDIMGDALLDYFHGRYTEDLVTWTNITEDDEMSLPYMFRDFEEMEPIEQVALETARGKVLDIGCGAGSHALYLQEKGLEVKGIDVSKGAVEVCKLRGLQNAENIHLLDLKDEKFDTIIILMNGTGIFRNLKEMPKYLQHLKSLLNENGQILVDSTDLIYMYRDPEDGSYLVPTDRYYGEVRFWMSYKGIEGKPFDWLYINEDIFEDYCKENGLNLEVIARGENYDYLAKLEVKE